MGLHTAFYTDRLITHPLSTATQFIRTNFMFHMLSILPFEMSVFVFYQDFSCNYPPKTIIRSISVSRSHVDISSVCGYRSGCPTAVQAWRVATLPSVGAVPYSPGLPWGWHFNPHTHPIPTGIPIGIPMGSPWESPYPRNPK